MTRPTARPTLTPPRADTVSESDILSAVLLALGSRPDVRLWRQNTGVARYAGTATRSGGVVRFGVPGQADLSGIVRAPCRVDSASPQRTLGLRLEIEVKTSRGKPTEKQLAWCAMIRRLGGIYLLVRSPEDAIAQLDAELARLATAPADAPAPGAAL